MRPQSPSRPPPSFRSPTSQGSRWRWRRRTWWRPTSIRCRSTHRGRRSSCRGRSSCSPVSPPSPPRSHSRCPRCGSHGAPTRRRRCALPDLVGIECRDVRKTYASTSGSVEALHAIDAAFPAGQLTALVGPSGCGKSTLLRLLAALDAIDAGTIDVGGRDIARLSPQELRHFRREQVTYVAQRAASNLVAHLRLRDHFEHRADLALLEPLGLAGHERSLPDQLSGGEQARAALAAAVARRTPIMLLDEPTAELDRATASHVVEELLAATQRGVTVVVATHDADVVAQAHAVVDMADHTPASDAARPPREATA